MSYQFRFDSRPRPADHIFEFNGVQVFVDPKSMVYLDGMTLDYVELEAGDFRFIFINPNDMPAATPTPAATGCGGGGGGCGCGNR